MAKNKIKTNKKNAIKKPVKIKKKTQKPKLPVKLITYLEKAGVKHEVLEHKTVYTAIDAAATMKKKLDEIAKSLLVKADKDYFLVLIPADQNLDFKKLGSCIGAQTGKKIKVIKIPGEKIMEKALKIKAGALTAFGNFHKIGVIMDKKFSKTKKAVFSSSSLNHSIEMAVKDFIKLENAVLGSIGVKKKIIKPVITKPKRKIKARQKAVKKKVK
ncbi:hypothetical protein DRH27_01760 [Candidatus Falkowbacteria bacterium]|nr:MAG: hypothetical protein DRH27_01760 [Candidatus Falkowbacteria bacterium]